MAHVEKNLIVFDWNGCLLDDFIVAKTAMNRILKNSGKAEVNDEEYRKKFDMPFTKMFSNFGFDEPPAGNVETYVATVNEFAPKVGVRNYTADLLLTARDNNVTSIIVSNSKVAVIESKLKENALDVFFTDIVGADHSVYGVSKNKSDNWAAYLEKHPADKIVTIGDTFEEIDMATRFGGTSVSITGGYTSGDRLSARQPDYLVNNLYQFDQVLRHIGFFQRNTVS